MTKTKKQQVIENLTELLAKVQQAYFAGKMEGHPLWVHEHLDDTMGISIDLYHFCGDGEPVCDGLTSLSLTLEAGAKGKADVFCMVYDPQEEHRLVFLIEPDDDELPDTMDVLPTVLPEQALENVYVWLQGQIQLGENDGYKIV